MPDIISYKLQLDADTAKAVKKLNDVNTKITELENGQILVDFKYNKNMADFNKKVKELSALNPKLGIQFQYDMNKRGYLQAKEKLEQMSKIKMEIDTKGSERYINELIANIKSLYKNGASEDVLTAPIQNLLNITKSIDKSQLSKIDIELGDIYDKFDKLYDLKPQQIFDLSEFEQINQDVVGFESAMDALKKKGAIDVVDTADNKELATLTERVTMLEDKMLSLQHGMAGINGNGFENAALGAKDLADQLLDVLHRMQDISNTPVKLENLINHVGNISKIGTNEYKRSDNLGALGEVLQGGLGMGSGLFFERAKTSGKEAMAAAAGYGSMSHSFENLKTYVIDLASIAKDINQLSFPTEAEEERGLSALRSINVFAAKAAMSEKEFAQIEDGIDANIYNTADELYNEVKEALPKIGMSFDEFKAFLDEQVAKIKSMGDMDEFGHYSNNSKYNNDPLPSDILLSKSGYTGFTPLYNGANDGEGIGGWFIYPEKVISAFEDAKEYIKVFTDTETKEAESFFDHINEYITETNAKANASVQQAAELRTALKNIIEGLGITTNSGIESNATDINRETNNINEQTEAIEKNTAARRENEQIDDSSNNISNAAIKQGEYYAKGLASAENLEKAGQAASLLSASALEALSEDDANFHLSGVAQANQYVRGLNEGLADANLNNDNINRQIVGSIDYQDVQNLENLTPLKNQLTEIIELITDKNRLFLEESELVASLVPQEVNNLESLYSTLIFIREEIEALQRAFAGLTFQGDINTEWVTSLSKLKNVDFTQISSSLSTMYQTISKLNLKDSNLLTSVQALLNKGKELENLAKVLSASAKDIKATKDATVSQKDKDTKASYQKELALRKEQRKLEHEINVAQAKGADNAAEIVAKNKPIIALLEKQVETEKERKNTSRQYRNEINAEISAIEKRNKAEVAGVKAATAEKNRKQTQTDLEKQIKELTGLREKLISLSEQTKKYTPEYLGDVTSQLSIIDNQIDTLKNAQTDIINAKDVAELDQISQDTKDIVKSTKAIKANASDTAYKIAKEIRVKSLKTEIADYLSKNTKLSREFRSELNLLIQKLNSGELTGDELLKLESRFEDIKTSAKQAREEGRSFFDQMRQRMTDMNAKFIAQFLSWQDLIRYIRQATQTVTELDSALTELRKVSDASTERLNQSFEKSAQTAQELGASITDVINMTADWARLGYNVDQAEDLARVTTLFETVGDNMTADKASSYLISTLQGFQLATDQAETIVDKYNEVANNFAIDTAGIGEALQRSAASFNAANTDLSKSIALVTATNEVLQNPESVGTLWKTLSARIRGATTELKDLGEEEDEFTQTTSKLRDLVKGLTGFDIMKDEKNFKDIYEIILGIGKEWDNLTDVERASLGEALAGMLYLPDCVVIHKNEYI